MRVIATDPAGQGPFVVINAADFDPAVHQRFEDEAPTQTFEDEAPTQTTRKPRAAKQPNTEA